MRLAKAHGLGNDFLLAAAVEAPVDASALARRLCARHEGMGADGLILYGFDGAAVTMRLLNADGGEAEISGNGLRCLAAYVVFKGWRSPRHSVLTGAGPKPVSVEGLGGARFRVATELGPPILDSVSIPMSLDPPRSPVVDVPVTAAGRELLVTATSLGNPHCVVFSEQPPDDALVAVLGSALERHPLFPRRTNVELATVVSPSELRVRFWERGVGPTQASGTGAASAAVAAMLRGLCGRRVRVVCDGGALDVEWPEGGGVRQVGEAEVLFEGDWIA